MVTDAACFATFSFWRNSGRAAGSTMLVYASWARMFERNLCWKKSSVPWIMLAAGIACLVFGYVLFYVVLQVGF